MNRALAGFVLAVAVATPAVGQTLPGADTLSPKAVADSQAVLQTLSAALAANPRDDAAWYRQAMIAWALSDRARATPQIRALDATRLRRVADTSLRRASDLAPANARYVLAQGRFLLWSGDAPSRLAAAGFFKRALDLARAGPDSVLRAECAIEAGRVAWRHYDSQAFRRIWSADENGPPVSLYRAVADDGTGLYQNILQGMTTIHNALVVNTQAVPGAGDADYLRAEELFREAYRASPGDTRAFRQLAMLLGERKRWTELRSVARDRVNRVPADGWAWLALGTALHRAGDSRTAASVFDTAMARIGASEKARLDNLTRVLRPADSVAYVRAPADARAGTDQSFWALADPLWSRDGNDSRTEYFARVTFAELRWTVEEMNVRGADSDRGAIHIRYGPPDTIGVVPAPGTSGRVGSGMSARDRPAGGAPRRAEDPMPTDLITYWDYDNGLSIIFWGPISYATARVPQSDQIYVAEVLDKTPARWDNVVTERIEGMPVRLARFRTPNDSIDLFLATLAPMASIHTASALNAPVTGSLWLLGENIPESITDQSPIPPDGVKAWVYRLAQANYMYRIEATADAALVAGRAHAWVRVASDSSTGFTVRGLGMSDLLIASRAQPQRTPAARWTDFAIVPLMTSAKRGGDIALVWENYELGERAGQARYEIALTIQRDRSTTGRILAEVASALANVVGIDRGSDRVTYRFDRTVAHAAAIVDNITISLRDTPPGNYRLTLEISDRGSGRRVSRSTVLTIAQ